MSLILALLGCAVEVEPLPSPAAFIETPEAEGVEVIPAGGSAPVRAFVRTVNEHGAALDAPDVELDVGDLSRQVTIDALGYGELYWAAEGSTRVSGGDGVVTLDITGSRWPGFGLMRAYEAPVQGAQIAVSLTAGVAVVSGNEVWWLGTDGRPHRVLEADSDIQGVRGRDVDVDGIRDVVVWTRNTVYLLRGRLSGGVAWGGALQAVGYSVGGVDIADLNNDNLPDLAIGWSQPESHLLDIWHGDGLGSFEPREPRNLDGEPSDVVIGDNSGEGKAQITVLYVDGSWSRFIDGRDGLYMPVGPQKPDKVSLPGSLVGFPGADVNGDDADELLAASPWAPAEMREIYLFELNRGVQVLPVEEAAAYIAVGDGNADGVADLWYLSDDRVLSSLSYERTGPQTGGYAPRDVIGLPEHGPITMSAFGRRDTVGDLFLAGNRLWWFIEGFTSAEDDAVDVYWRPGGPEVASVGQGIRSPLALVEIEEQPGTNQIVVFREVEGPDDDEVEIELALLAQRPGEVPVRAGGVTLWSGGPQAADLVACERDVYVVGQGRLLHVSLDDPTNPVIRREVSIDEDRARVDCGEGPVGASVVALDGDQIVLYSATLDELERSSSGDAGDVTLVDLGSGPEVRTCSGAGCHVVGWSRADGTVVVARSTSDTLELVDRTGRAEVVVGGGRLQIADVDRDGRDDLLSVRAGAPEAPTGALVVLHRASSDGLVPAEVFHSSLAARGDWVVVSDADGDRESDLWFADQNGVLHHTYAPVPVVEAVVTDDTGDTSSVDTSAHTGLLDTAP
jgi:hypothetical protein